MPRFLPFVALALAFALTGCASDDRVSADSLPNASPGDAPLINSSTYEQWNRESSDAPPRQGQDQLSDQIATQAQADKANKQVGP